MSVLLIVLMRLVNGARFLNVTPFSLSSLCLAAALFSSPLIHIVALTYMYASA